MKTIRPPHWSLLVLAAATAVVACQSQSPNVVSTSASPEVSPPVQAAMPSVAPTAAPVAVVPAEPKARTVKLLPSPAVDERQTVARFWSYGQDAPFEVTSFEATAGHVNPENGHAQIAFEADVRLPAVGPLGAMRVLQAAEATGICAVPTLDPLSDTSAGQLPPGADASAIDQIELAQNALLPDAQEAPRMLSLPHHVTGVADNEPFMSNATDHYIVTDQYTGEVVRLEYDQEWTHFELIAGADHVSLDFNPDGTYLVDGQPAATPREAVRLLEQSPVVANASPYSLAMMTARIGRLTPPGSRGTPTCNPPSDLGEYGTRVHYRTLSADSPDPQARAFVLANAILKDVLTNAMPASAASERP